MKRILLSLGIVAAASMLNVRTAPQPLAAALSMAFAAPGDCILECWDSPPYCEGTEHDAWWVSSPTNEYGGGYHSVQSPCWPGICATKHPDCSAGSFTASNLEALRLALVAEDVSRIDDAVRTIGRQSVSVNHDRSAVQLIGCAGDVIAHLPIPARLTDQLSE